MSKKKKTQIKITRRKIETALSKMEKKTVPDFVQSEMSSLLQGPAPKEEVVLLLKPLVIATIRLWIEEFKLKRIPVKTHLMSELIPAGEASQETIETQLSSFALAIGDDLTLEEKRALVAQHSGDTIDAVAGIVAFYILENEVWRKG